MSDIWRVFWITNCVHTIPPKNKWVVIVCIDDDCMGFFINKTINSYVLKRPVLLASQVAIKKADYGFLRQDSYIDCQLLYPYDVYDLNDGRGNLLESTISDVKKVVSDSKTLEKRYINMILAN